MSTIFFQNYNLFSLLGTFKSKSLFVKDIYF
jgi:hypothetical protein